MHYKGFTFRQDISCTIFSRRGSERVGSDVEEPLTNGATE